MTQIKINLSDRAIQFIERHKELGYDSKSMMIDSILTKCSEDLEREEITRSASLYQEVYEEDKELQQLTDNAASLCLE